MYFLSGEATCLKVMPAWAVMSVKAILGGLPASELISHAKAQRRKEDRKVRDRITDLQA